MRFEEVLDYDFRFFEDKDAGKPRMRILATVQQADTVNKNGRLYPRQVLDKATRNFQARLLKRGFGQVDHPERKGALKDTSHLVTKLFWDKKNSSLLNAEMTILRTPAGEALKEIIKAGGRPGLSSRGQGDSTRVKKNGQEVEVIKDGFRFDSFDFVLNPSVSSTGIRKIFESAKVEDDSPNADVIKKMTLEELKEKYPHLIEEAVEKELRFKRKMQSIAGITGIK